MYYPALRRLLLRVGLLSMPILLVTACGGPQELEPRSLPEVRQALWPGEYRSEEFRPSLSFRIGEGWSTSPPEASDTLFITQGETRALGFVNVQEVYKPTRTGTPNVAEAPKDIVGWFQQHRYLQTSRVEAVTVGGAEGERFDVVLRDLPEDHFGVCGIDCVDLFRLSIGGLPVFLSEEDKVRVIVLENVKGETVTIGFGSPATEFDEFAPEAQKVIDSVRWRTL